MKQNAGPWTTTYLSRNFSVVYPPTVKCGGSFWSENMSTFSCSIVLLDGRTPHPWADTLECVQVDGFTVVVKKGLFNNGDIALYIPEQAIVPDHMLDEMGLLGALTGPGNNVVRAKKIRGVLSQGLLYPISWDLVANVGDDIADFFGIKKYEPTIPVQFGGDLSPCIYTKSYDIENIKKYPDVLLDGEEVVITEKIHGTWACFAFIPHKEDSPFLVTSKGLSNKRLIFKDLSLPSKNVYIRMFHSLRLEEILPVVAGGKSLYVFGEIYGKGVQDLSYEAAQPRFRAFDIFVGNSYDGTGKFLDYEQKQFVFSRLGVDSVPVLYKGEYSKETLDHFTNGMEEVSGAQSHIREGVVVFPAMERDSNKIGRVILKSISRDYLLRKHGTEYT